MGSLRRLLLIGTVIGIGVWLRTLPAVGVGTGLARWWTWTQPTIATLYFSDGRFLVPVSRRVASTTDMARSAVEAFLDGPAPRTNLTTLIPRGTTIDSLDVHDGIATLDLKMRSGVIARGQPATTAIVHTLTAIPGITAVTLTVNDAPIVTRARPTPLLYFASANGLAAMEASAGTARELLDRYLAGPPDGMLTGLPRDVRLLKYEEDTAHGIIRLDFSDPDSLRTLAVEKPDVTRFVLLGLIATMTEFPGVHTVTLNFGDRSRLGLGQCTDLLRVPQPRPQLLNDERLLGI